jgi:Ca-activated chloride channel family protein
MNKVLSFHKRFRSRPGLWLLCAFAMLSLLLVTSARSQNCVGCSSFASSAEPASEQAWVIRKQVNEVSVFFTASARGKLIPDLTKEDLNIRDDNQLPAAIVEFHSQHDLPLRVGLLVDTSGSVHDRMRFEQAAAKTFLREVIQGQADLGFVMGFANAATLTQDLTADATKLSSGVAAFKAQGGTALFDAIASACAKLLSHDDDQVVARVLIVLSDGDDNSSRIKLDEAVDRAQQAEVAIYTISTNPRAQNAHDFDSQRKGKENLKALAERTGGRALRPDCVGDVRNAFAKVQEELRYRYAVSYRPANFVADGHYRRIQIVAHQPGKKIRVRAREGYYAKLPSPALAWDKE